ncbi:MAG TPA: type II secretion system F family protein [Blastocatellia bacterium]|nr:type II secretion system F family protein [Blastocatellia bacterium]
MSILVTLSVFIFITLAGIAVYLLLFRRQNTLFDRLQPSKPAKGGPISENPEVAEGFAERMTKPIQRLAPPSVTEAEKLQKQMMQAGYLAHNAPSIFHAIQLAAMFGLPLVTALACFPFALPFSKIALYALIAFIAGFYLPKYFLKKLIARRQERLSWGLADALDLMVVSIEAGLGINAALVRVSEELKDVHPEIGEEFELVNLEIRVGRDRTEALRNLSERTGVEDLRGLVAMLIQADRFGTSIGRAVRIYSDSLRTKRRQRAEQAAQKAAVKLLFPLTCFLFPTLFIIILGPAGIALMDTFSGMGK